MSGLAWREPNEEVIETLRSLLASAEAGNITVFGGFAIGPDGWEEFVRGEGLEQCDVIALGAAEMLKQHLMFRIMTGKSPE